MQVVDTNIAAYRLIEGDQTALALRLAELDPDWHSEPFLLVEFTNILTCYVAARRLTLPLARELLLRAEHLFRDTLHDFPNVEVLHTASEFRVSAYDARFLVAAKALGCRLVTEDKKLRAAAPKLTQSLKEALANLETR